MLESFFRLRLLVRSYLGSIRGSGFEETLGELKDTRMGHEGGARVQEHKDVRTCERKNVRIMRT